MSKKYTADDIQTLEFKEAIRTRIEMYMGDAGNNGVIQTIREIITNSIDEYIMGHGNKISVKIDTKNNFISVQDNARGVPFENRSSDGVSAMVALYTLPHTGAKFDGKLYEGVAGMNGSGGKAVALSSEKFTATSIRDGKKATLILDKGVPVDFKIENTSQKGTGTLVEYTPSKGVYHLEEINIDINEVFHMCETWAYLFPGLTIEVLDMVKGKKETYSYSNGIKDLIKNNTSKTVNKSIIYNKVEEDGVTIEVALQWSRERTTKDFVYTNGLQQVNGGTSLTGARTALTRTLNSLTGEKLSGDSARKGLVWAINARVPKASFSDQTKTKVNNPELRGAADKAVSDALRSFSSKNPSEWEKIVEVLVKEEKAERAAELARERVLNTEKEIMESSRKGNIDLPEKVVDATNKTGYRELFLTEGDSASGFLKATRDAATQGVMPLRGKILNTFDLDLPDAYENEEVKAIFTLLGAGAGSRFNINKLRYDKIIIATDADSDGDHISLLIIALFLKHAPKLIEDGKLYRVLAPFYGVTHQGKYKIFYSEEEFEEFEKKYGKQSKIDRYKGLGAMNEDLVEKYVMSDERKLVQIKMSEIDEMTELFETLLGKDIEGRRKLVRTGEIE